MGLYIKLIAPRRKERKEFCGVIFAKHGIKRL